MKSLSILCVTTALTASLALVPAGVRADERAPAALTGQVTSDAEAAMEGVVVTARKDGSIVSTSVTTDAKGRYAFPAVSPFARSVTICPRRRLVRSSRRSAAARSAPPAGGVSRRGIA